MVQFDKMANDGEAKAETGAHFGMAVVALPEAIEDVRQKIGGDSDAGVHNLDLNMIVVRPERDFNSSFRRCELYGIGE